VVTRGIRIAALALVTTVALSSCVRVLADTTVHADDTYSQRAVFAFTDEVAGQLGEQVGGELPDFLSEVGTNEAFVDLQERYPNQVTVADYVEGDREGVEFTIENLPLDEFNSAAGNLAGGAGINATLNRVDDTYVVTISLDEGPDVDALGGAGGDLGLIESAIDFEIIYRFPGQVTEASAGTIDGNTVTLGLSDVTTPGDIRIVAGAEPAINWAPIIRWGLVGLAFVVIIGGATLLVLQDRRRRHTSHLPPPRTTEPD
jgi:hypothetical protein